MILEVRFLGFKKSILKQFSRKSRCWGSKKKLKKKKKNRPKKCIQRIFRHSQHIKNIGFGSPKILNMFLRQAMP